MMMLREIAFENCTSLRAAAAGKREDKFSTKVRFYNCGVVSSFSSPF
jgi:hypothetical protein